MVSAVSDEVHIVCLCLCRLESGAVDAVASSEAGSNVAACPDEAMSHQPRVSYPHGGLKGVSRALAGTGSSIRSVCLSCHADGRTDLDRVKSHRTWACTILLAGEQCTSLQSRAVKASKRLGVLPPPPQARLSSCCTDPFNIHRSICCCFVGCQPGVILVWMVKRVWHL